MAHRVRIVNISDEDSEGVIVRTYSYSRDTGGNDENTAVARGGNVEVNLADIDSLSIDDVTLQTQNQGTVVTFQNPAE